MWYCSITYRSNSVIRHNSWPFTVLFIIRRDQGCGTGSSIQHQTSKAWRTHLCCVSGRADNKAPSHYHTQHNNVKIPTLYSSKVVVLEWMVMSSTPVCYWPSALVSLSDSAQWSWGRDICRWERGGGRSRRSYSWHKHKTRGGGLHSYSYTHRVVLHNTLSIWRY